MWGQHGAARLESGVMSSLDVRERELRSLIYWNFVGESVTLIVFHFVIIGRTFEETDGMTEWKGICEWLFGT